MGCPPDLMVLYCCPEGNRALCIALHTGSSFDLLTALLLSISNEHPKAEPGLAEKSETWLFCFAPLLAAGGAEGHWQLH